MAFIDRRDYVVHINKVHSNHRPFGCTSCGMAYKTKQGLTSHLKSHPDGDCIHITRRARGPTRKDVERPFGCTECGKKFIKEAKLKSHMKVHNKTKPPPPAPAASPATSQAVDTKPRNLSLHCPFQDCDKVFNHQHLLKSHLKDHNIQAPVNVQQPDSQTFVLKPAVVQGSIPSDPNLLPVSLQQALSQHQKAVGIPQSLNPNPSRNTQATVQNAYTHAYAVQPASSQQHMRLVSTHPPHHQAATAAHQLSSAAVAAAAAQQEIPNATSHVNEFYQHYAANIATFNHMYKQS